MFPVASRWLRLVGVGISLLSIVAAAANEVSPAQKLAAEVSRLEDDFLAAVEKAPNPVVICDSYEQALRGLMRNHPGELAPYIGLLELFEKCDTSRTLRLIDEFLAQPDLPGGVRAPYEAARRTAALVGSPLDLTFVSLAGEPIRLAELRGQVVVIDFWATWCGPCLREQPRLQALYQAHRKDGLAIFGISFDRERVKLDSYLKTHPLSWPQAYPSAAEKDELARVTGVSGGVLPTIFIIGRDGRLRHTSNSRFRIEEKVTALLNERVGE